jgi:hypothetical protein
MAASRDKVESMLRVRFPPTAGRPVLAVEEPKRYELRTDETVVKLNRTEQSKWQAAVYAHRQSETIMH